MICLQELSSLPPVLQHLRCATDLISLKLTTGTLIKETSHITLCNVWIDLHYSAAMKSYRCILHSLAHALMVLVFTPVQTYKMWKDKMVNHFRGTPCIKRPWKAATIKGRNAPGLRQTSGLACWAWKMQLQVFKGNNLQGNQKLS